MKRFFIHLFNDKNSINEKAIMGFFSFLIMVIFALVDVILGILGKTFTINQFIFDAFEVLTITCFGIASLDKFINKRNNSEENGE